jgi:hypothetical protein
MSNEQSRFRKAERKKGKFKGALVGSSGCGKTWTSIKVMRGLIGEDGQMAVADTENGSAELYSHLTPFDITIIEPDYTVQKFLDVIDAATAEGYQGLIVDGISPFWVGKGGLLNYKTNLEKRGKNSFTAWAEITPLYQEFVSAILHAKLHLICTLRAKTDYSMTTDNGITKVIKQGLAPIMRDELDFEFTTVFMLDQQHKATVSKDRTSIFEHRGIFDIGSQTGIEILNWLNSGADTTEEVDVSKIITTEKVMKFGQQHEKEYTTQNKSTKTPKKTELDF